MNPICPICGLYELNDGSEETLYTCECEEGFFDEEVEEPSAEARKESE